MAFPTRRARAQGHASSYGKRKRARPRHRVAQGKDQAKRSKKLELENTLMKPLPIAIIGALVVAVAVFGYLYYQRTSNDITTQMPKVELKN